MEETNKQEPGQALSAEQVSDVAGGAGSSCPATVTVGVGGTQIVQTGTSTGDALINVYDGLVDATSHVIETVARAAK